MPVKKEPKKAPKIDKEKELQKAREKLADIIVKHRATIPEQYNKVLMLDYLFDDEVDMYVSITTRGDGKTYNYLYTLLDMSFNVPEFKFVLVARHYTLRNAYWNLLEKIIAENNFDKKNVVFRRTDDYVQLYYNNEPVCLITDLNNVSDLKYHSNILRDYRFIVYDEFLAINGDYLPDEAERLKTLYESIDRGTGYVMESPKILLMGNPVNFDSPLLSYFDLFDYLEAQPINTVQKHDNVVIERFRNDEVNDQKNKRLFNNSENESLSGEFRVNKSYIADDKYRSEIKYVTIVRLGQGYNLYIEYTTPQQFYLRVNAIPARDYDFSFKMVDVTPEKPLITDTYFMPYYHLKHESGKILYSDTFTLNYFDTHAELKDLYIPRLISRAMQKLDHTPYEQSELNDKNYAYSHQKELLARLNREYEQF